jgi:hypothetical protein
VLAALDEKGAARYFRNTAFSPRQTAPFVCENHCNAFLSLLRSLLPIALAESPAQAKRLFKIVAAAKNYPPC